MGVNGTQAAILFGERDQVAYRMFEARDLSAEGAFLSGPLLLEVDEEVDVELRFTDHSSVTVRARVTGVARGGDPPGMSVSFAELGDEARKQLETKLGTNHG